MRKSIPAKSHHHRWRRKIFTVLLFGICFSTLLLLEAQYSRIRTLSSLYHHPSVQKPKIAFLFIARNRLPLEMVWDAFFQVPFSVLCIFFFHNWVYYFSFYTILIITYTSTTMHLYFRSLMVWACCIRFLNFRNIIFLFKKRVWLVVSHSSLAGLYLWFCFITVFFFFFFFWAVSHEETTWICRFMLLGA